MARPTRTSRGALGVLAAVLLFALPPARGIVVSGRPAPWFTRPFDPTNPPNPCLIVCYPTNTASIYSQGDVITVSNTAGTRIDVFDSTGTFVASNASSPLVLARLPVGHYFVQVDHDRSQFAVLPKNRQRNFLGFDLWPSDDGRVRGARFGWGRIHTELRWETVETNSATAWNWSRADRVLAHNAGFGIKITATLAYPRPIWQTNNDTYNADYSNFVWTVIQKYTNRISCYEVFNEPYYGNVPTYAGQTLGALGRAAQ